MTTAGDATEEEAAAPAASSGSATTMRAAFSDAYGPFEDLRVTEIPRPEIAADEVLVRVRAAGLHVGDLFVLRGSPVLVRMDTGLFRPKYGVPGFDLAGVVEAVGAEVGRVRPGDEVFGSGQGSAAEYARAKAEHLAPKPEGLSFEEAAALTTSGLAALHGLRDAGGLQAGQKVLINGASGGVGTYALQIAKALGAEVTGVSSAGNHDLLRSLGADHVIDYRQEDFTQGEARYDLILDNVENHPMAEVRRALAPEGTLILNSGTSSTGFTLLWRMVQPLLLSPFTKQHLKRFLSTPKREDLEVLATMVEEGKLRPVVGRTFDLEEIQEAFALIAGGHSKGKVVLRIGAA